MKSSLTFAFCLSVIAVGNVIAAPTGPFENKVVSGNQSPQSSTFIKKEGPEEQNLPDVKSHQADVEVTDLTSALSGTESEDKTEIKKQEVDPEDELDEYSDEDEEDSVAADIGDLFIQQDNGRFYLNPVNVKLSCEVSVRGLQVIWNLCKQYGYIKSDGRALFDESSFTTILSTGTTSKYDEEIFCGLPSKEKAFKIREEAYTQKLKYELPKAAWGQEATGMIKRINGVDHYFHNANLLNACDDENLKHLWTSIEESEHIKPKSEVYVVPYRNTMIYVLSGLGHDDWVFDGYSSAEALQEQLAKADKYIQDHTYGDFMMTDFNGNPGQRIRGEIIDPTDEEADNNPGNYIFNENYKKQKSEDSQGSKFWKFWQN